MKDSAHAWAELPVLGVWPSQDRTRKGSFGMKEGSGRRGREGNDDPADVCVLELPATLRQIRDHKKISRAKTYRRLDEAATPNYLYELERGIYKPSQTMLDGLVTGYRLNKDQARYLRELSYPSVDLE